MDYTNGKIYKITNCVDNEVYVGSTTQSLSRRFSKHKEDSKYRNNKVHSHFDKIGIDNFCISLIEDYPCTTKSELLLREGHYIRELGTLNTIVSGRTQKEYQQDNKEHILKRMKEYRENNKEKDKEYYQNNKEKISEKKKEYQQENKEQIREQRKQKIECDICKTIVQKNSMYNHQKSLKCQSSQSS